MKTLGQILFAIGLTLLIGGVASFYFDNIELEFLNRNVNTESSRILWIIVNFIIALFGFLLMRFANIKSKMK